MAITNLEEKENRKLWVPIRDGNRGGWSLFEWEKVREMPYRDREMYLGNSAKIGILDKGGKWRKKDWYLHKNKLATGQQLSSEMSEARKRDQDRMKAALGISGEEETEQKLTPAEMQMLLKRIRGNKEEGSSQVSGAAGAIGLGFDKTKVEIRGRPSAKEQNPHRLQGNIGQFQQDMPVQAKKQKHKQRSRSRSEKKKKKHKKQKHQKRQHSVSEEKKAKKERHRSRSSERGQRRHKDKKHKHRQKRN